MNITGSISRAFIATFSMKKNIIPCLKTASKFVLLLASLPKKHVVKKTAYRAVCAIGNKVPNCQQVHKVLQNLCRASTEWGSSRSSLKYPRNSFKGTQA
jgi:hypothetical protein